MLKNTHVEVGLSFYLLAIYLLFTIGTSIFSNTELYFPIYALLLLPILAVLPDMDHPWSMLNQKFPFLKPISTIYWHRTWSHDIFTIAILSSLIYFWLWNLFNYFDYSESFSSLWLLDKWKFFIYSKEWWAIFLTTFAHSFADWLTAWSVAYFFWVRKIYNWFKKIHPIFGIILFPLWILIKIEDIFSALKAQIMPLTWGIIETYWYALVFNIINILWIGYLLFINWSFIWFKSLVISTIQHLNNPYYILPFFLVSIIYFFSMTFGKLQQYLSLMKKTIIFLISSTIFLLILWYTFNHFDFVNNYKSLIFLGIGFVWLYWIYKKYINMKFDFFNILINEIILLIFYIMITFIVLIK